MSSYLNQTPTITREWKDNLFNGFGIYKYKNGDIYEVCKLISDFLNMINCSRGSGRMI